MAARSRKIRELAVRDAIEMFDDNGLPGKRLVLQLERDLAGPDDDTFGTKYLDRMEYIIDLHLRAEAGSEEGGETQAPNQPPAPEPEVGLAPAPEPQPQPQSEPKKRIVDDLQAETAWLN